MPVQPINAKPFRFVITDSLIRYHISSVRRQHALRPYRPPATAHGWWAQCCPRPQPTRPRARQPARLNTHTHALLTTSRHTYCGPLKLMVFRACRPPNVMMQQPAHICTLTGPAFASGPRPTHSSQTHAFLARLPPRDRTRPAAVVGHSAPLPAVDRCTATESQPVAQLLHVSGVKVRGWRVIYIVRLPACVCSGTWQKPTSCRREHSRPPQIC